MSLGWLEGGRQSRPAEIKDGEERSHDGGGPSDDDPGDDSGFAVRVAFGDGIGPAPNFKDAPKEPEHEHDAKGGSEALSKLGGRTAGGLRENERTENGVSAEGDISSRCAGQC
jgi:hypothetical protein